MRRDPWLWGACLGGTLVAVGWLWAAAHVIA